MNTAKANYDVQTQKNEEKNIELLQNMTQKDQMQEMLIAKRDQHSDLIDQIGDVDAETSKYNTMKDNLTEDLKEYKDIKASLETELKSLQKKLDSMKKQLDGQQKGNIEKNAKVEQLDDQ